METLGLGSTAEGVRAGTHSESWRKGEYFRFYPSGAGTADPSKVRTSGIERILEYTATVEERSIATGVGLCPSVCPLADVKNHISKLYQFFYACRERKVATSRLSFFQYFHTVLTRCFCK